MNPTLIIASRAEAERIMRIGQPKIGAVVCVIDEDYDTLPEVEAADIPKLIMSFDDVCGSTAYCPCLQHHVEQVIAFAESLKGQKLNCLVHCFAGVSRSPAIGIIMQCVWMKNMEDAVRSVFAMNPDARPNPLVISFADIIWETDGELFNLVEACKKEFNGRYG